MYLSPGLELVALSFDGMSIESTQPRCSLSLDQKVLVGRSHDNHMVLDDPSRCVSRSQASLSLTKDGSVVLENISGSVSIFVNDNELRPGQSQKVCCSDRVLIGRYVVGLEEKEKPLSDTCNVSEIKEPLFNGGAAEPDTTNVRDTYIPEDFDIFAEPQASDENVADTFDLNELSDPLCDTAQSLIEGLDETSQAARSLDHPQMPESRLLGDALEHIDPLALLRDEAVHNNDLEQMFSGNSQADHGSELSMPFVAPTPVKRNEAESSDVSAQARDASSGSELLKSTRSMRSSPELSKISSAPADVLDSGPESISGDDVMAEQLRTAFSETSGVAVDHLPAFDEKFAATLGSLLSHLTAGTIEMVHARSVTKHEMRANVTIIAAAGNNPLKFAPDAQSALTQLIAPTFSGFMDPMTSIDEAFEDLAAHQVGLMMGARAAVYEVVNKFSPERLGRYLASNQVMDCILPMSRKSRLWELYEANYSDLAGDAKEDFEVLFQQAFAEAYEKEVERVQEARALQ